MEVLTQGPRLQVRRFGHWHSAAQASRIEGLGATKLYVRVRPRGGGSFADQAHDLYRELGALLQEQGLRRQDVITERIYFGDLAAQAGEFLQARAAFYGPAYQPATTYLHQPPCWPGVQCELQARVIIANGADPVVVRDLEAELGAGAGKVVSYRGHDHFYLHNVTGQGQDFSAQAAQVFARAAAALAQEGLNFQDVIRTWLFLPNMERDYSELNQTRMAFFARHQVERLPASTGIQGGVYPCDRGLALDLYALRSQRPVQVEVMRAHTMNEAPSYGSFFSRGLAVTREDRKVAYVSGTASIDARGQVVHVGDIEGQVHRMLTNVEDLLASVGARICDAVRATTYLKNSDDADCLTRVLAERGVLQDIPHTVCRAEVCRPEWLCEIELVAIFDPAAIQPAGSRHPDALGPVSAPTPSADGRPAP